MSITSLAEWQALLDEKFPQGMQISAVLSDGTLSKDEQFSVPILMVMEMDGAWPHLYGMGSTDGKDIDLRINSWSELDRDGRFAARVTTADGKDYELSSWLSEVQVEEMAPLRKSQRSYLSQMVSD